MSTLGSIQEKAQAVAENSDTASASRPRTNIDPDTAINALAEAAVARGAAGMNFRAEGLKEIGKRSVDPDKSITNSIEDFAEQLYSPGGMSLQQIDKYRVTARQLAFNQKHISLEREEAKSKLGKKTPTEKDPRKRNRKYAVDKMGHTHRVRYVAPETAREDPKPASSVADSMMEKGTPSTDSMAGREQTPEARQAATREVKGPGTEALDNRGLTDDSHPLNVSFTNKRGSSLQEIRKAFFHSRARDRAA